MALMWGATCNWNAVCQEYPVDPTAAAGMTSGLPNSNSARQIEMMQVRTSAQDAQAEAAAASMARSAGQSMDDRNRDAALQDARTNKAIKEQMRNRLRYEKVAAQQEKVTAHDMSTWQQNGGVRVERNVPDAFITSLIAEEEQAMARGRVTAPKKRFSLSSLNPLPVVGDAISSVHVPRLPFTGGHEKEEAAPAASPVAATDQSEPVFASTGRRNSSAPQSAPIPAPSKPGMIPSISGAALVDGRAPAISNSSRSNSVSSAQRVSFAEEAAPSEKKKFSLFSRNDSNQEADADNSMPTSQSEEKGGGFLGFGRKKSSTPVPGIDASLFPGGTSSPSVQRVSTGSSNSSSSSRSTSGSSSSGDSFASDTVSLPSHEIEKERKGGFSIPRPSLPSLPSLSKSEGGSRGGSVAVGFATVSQTAQFMVYGADQMQSEIRALPAGTSVEITKPGEQWSGIRLSDGTEGVVQNKFLRSSGN